VKLPQGVDRSPVELVALRVVPLLDEDDREAPLCELAPDDRAAGARPHDDDVALDVALLDLRGVEVLHLGHPPRLLDVLDEGRAALALEGPVEVHELVDERHEAERGAERRVPLPDPHQLVLLESGELVEGAARPADGGLVEQLVREAPHR
jgi:hypothetical protein